MGKTKIKTIDDSVPEAEEKKKKKIKISTKTERTKVNEASREEAKLELAKAIGEVERTPEANDLNEKSGAKQTNSERTGDASGALQPSEPLLTNKQQDLKLKRKATKPQTKKTRSKKYQEAKKLVNSNQKYPLDEAIKLAQTTSYSKFPGTIEAHFNTNVKNLRGFVSLPFSQGKKLTILVFGPKTEGIKDVLWGNDQTIEEIEKGKTDFDLVITTPEWMPKLAKLAKVLGPKGLMPSPKNGTIVPSPEGLIKVVADFQGGKTEYKTENNGTVIHLSLGKVNQPAEEIGANLKALTSNLGKSKLTKITLSPSMGPGIKVNLTSI